MLRYIFRLKSAICGFDNYMRVRVSVLATIICISSASAITIFLVVALWVCW